MNLRLAPFVGAVSDFAWDGMATQLPANWNLSAYRYSNKLCHLEFQDEYTVRLEIEITRPRQPITLAHVQKRYEAAARPLTRTATENGAFPNLPSGWGAHAYQMEDGYTLVTAFYLAPRGRFFAFLRIFFSPEDQENPGAIVRLISSSIKVQTDPVLWRLFDINLELPAAFRLVETKLEAGRKLMVFHWRLRRLYVWHFSLANLLLKDEKPEQWTVDFLNRCKALKGPRFSLRGKKLVATRSSRHPLGHFEEIGRLCFRYFAVCQHRREQNQLVVFVFNYRREQDLDMLPQRWRTLAGGEQS